jgi:thiosulfate/3-mercaptopyruvate sulfurtransferase
MNEPSFPRSSTLVSVDLLRQHLADPAWCVVDCRHDLMDPAAGRLAYEAGHVPHARFADIEHDLSGPKTPDSGRHPLPDREHLAARFRAWGISPGTQIVAYDAQGGQFAGRLWWLARWLGHDAVALLDGGWPTWLAETGRAEAGAAPPARGAGDFAARASLMPVVDAGELQSRLGDPSSLLVDARAAERYEGRVEPIDPVAGHIPGAVNRFWQENLLDGRFKRPDALRSEFLKLLQNRPPTRVIHHCGSGVTAAHNLLAMEIAGLPGAALYPGSWSEWIRDPARPVAQGPHP